MLTGLKDFLRLHCVVDCIADCIWFAVPQATERQGIRNETDAAMICARTDFV